MFQALRIPDFRLLWGSSLVSSFGSWLLVLAIPILLSEVLLLASFVWKPPDMPSIPASDSGMRV